MNEHQQQLQLQLDKLPGSMSLDVDSRACTMTMRDFTVYVDYHKRRGLKLSTSVFEIADGALDGSIMVFLRNESKNKKKGSGRIEWSGESEVLFIQEYPKNIIDDNQWKELGQALEAYHESIVAIRSKILMIQSSKHSAGSNEFNQSQDDYDIDTEELAVSEPSIRLPLPSRKQSWNIKPPKEPKTSDGLVDDNSASINGVNSAAGNASISAGRMIRRFGRKKREKQPNFVALCDDQYSDEESSEPHMSFGLPGL